MTGIRKRILNPGCKFDHMVIIEGGQGIYKSELLKILGGDHYAALSIEVSDKALMENMCGKWFIEFDEMSGWGVQDVERVKSLITRTIDRRRPPYGLQSTDFKRQCVLAGTLNPKKNNEYLRDDTGNRRFWPIVCNTERINIEWVKENRDQLFAEAKVCCDRGDSLWLDGEGENEIAVQVQNERLQTDTWGEIIRERLKFEMGSEISMGKILTDYLGMKPERITKAFETRVGIIMGKIEAWEKVQDWKDRKYFYRRR